MQYMIWIFVFVCVYSINQKFPDLFGLPLLFQKNKNPSVSPSKVFLFKLTRQSTSNCPWGSRITSTAMAMVPLTLGHTNEDPLKRLRGLGIVVSCIWAIENTHPPLEFWIIHIIQSSYMIHRWIICVIEFANRYLWAMFMEVVQVARVHAWSCEALSLIPGAPYTQQSLSIT